MALIIIDTRSGRGCFTIEFGGSNVLMMKQDGLDECDATSSRCSTLSNRVKPAQGANRD